MKAEIANPEGIVQNGQCGLAPGTIFGVAWSTRHRPPRRLLDQYGPRKSITTLAPRVRRQAQKSSRGAMMTTASVPPLSELDIQRSTDRS
jgi:hypothetical protein